MNQHCIIPLIYVNAQLQIAFLPPNFITVYTMPRRLPLAPIAHNRRPNTELSNEAKSVIYGRALAGQTDREIALAEGLKQPTIKSIIRRVAERKTLANKQRTDGQASTQKETRDTCIALRETIQNGPMRRSNETQA